MSARSHALKEGLLGSSKILSLLGESTFIYLEGVLLKKVGCHWLISFFQISDSHERATLFHHTHIQLFSLSSETIEPRNQELNPLK